MYLVLVIVAGFVALIAVLYNRLVRDRNRVDAAWSDSDARGEKEEQLGAEVHRLLAVAENYPDLKANENFLSLQNELVETENYLQFARRFYNGSVRQFNTRVETVPANMVAGWFGFTQRGFFQKASDDVANVPLVKMGAIE